jgi:hypothetical protein
MRSRAVRTVLTIAVNVLIAVAVLLALRLIALFTAQFAASGWGSAVTQVTHYLVIPFGFAGIKTPYGGVFSVNAAVTIVVILVIEWVLSGLRDRA